MLFRIVNIIRRELGSLVLETMRRRHVTGIGEKNARKSTADTTSDRKYDDTTNSDDSNVDEQDIDPHSWYCYKRPKPLMRGVLHVLMVCVSPLWWTPMLRLCKTSEAKASVILSLMAKTALFLTSGAFHQGSWTFQQEKLVYRFDTAAISGMIAYSIAPIYALLVPEGWTFIAVSTLCAAISAGLAFLDVSKNLRVASYLLQGGVSTYPLLSATLTLFEMHCLAMCGVFYVSGAMIYARENPEFFPKIFGYHEIWHLHVVLAAMASYAANVSVLLRAQGGEHHFSSE